MKLEDWYKKTERPEERALRRKLRREAILKWIGLVVLVPLSLILFWLLLVVTPDQSSAVNDLEPSRARLGTGEPRPSGRGTGQGEPSLARLGTEQEDRRE